jgi:pantothenate kinase
LGGGTLWGLMALLTDCKDFDEMLALAGTGDNARVDMLVGDIYGGDYPAIGLKASTIASSFGKARRAGLGARWAAWGGCGLTLWRYATTPTQCFQYAGNAANARAHFAQADLAKSALFMVSNNIGQIAYLNAHKHGVATIYFAGSFIRGHPDTMKTISYAVNFWSQGAMTGTPQPHGSARMCVHGCAYLCM